MIFIKRRKLLCYGPFCYPKRVKHDREKLKTDWINHKHYCVRCYRYIKTKRLKRHRLYSYIKQKARVSYPTPIMLRDIKKLRKCHYTYQGILSSLKYANSHSFKFSFKGQFFLRYVPYVYETAQKWQYRRNKHNDLTIDLHALNNKVQKASVDSKRFDESKKNPHYTVDKSILN